MKELCVDALTVALGIVWLYLPFWLLSFITWKIFLSWWLLPTAFVCVLAWVAGWIFIEFLVDLAELA